MDIREILEQREEETLSVYAAKASQSKGRKLQEDPCPLRTDYQRDRDRIIHCNAFRRLRLKTQVFLTPKGDHYRTRLTHTMEVSQVARTIARALRLNEDLTEAIALGHDVGHTPFGHAGERALREVCPFPFNHYEQSVRVLERYEKQGKGLNLTFEVLDGIRCHTPGSGFQVTTQEGKVVEFADRIAYINHDIEDAIRAGILSESDIPAPIVDVLGHSKSQRITSLVLSLIQNSGAEVKMDDETYKAYLDLHSFMFESVYKNPLAKQEEGKAKDCMKRLYDHLLHNPDLLPGEYRRTMEAEGVERAACDYIAGMSDDYLMTVYSETYLPKAWAKY